MAARSSAFQQLSHLLRQWLPPRFFSPRFSSGCCLSCHIILWQSDSGFKHS